MAERIELFQVTCPLGTAITAPFSANLSMDEAAVERIEVTVPKGPSGLMGFRLRHSAQTVIPYKGTNWIVTDGEVLSWPVSGYPTGDKWSIQMYNTDIFDHTVYIRLLVNEVGATPRKSLPILTIG